MEDVRGKRLMILGGTAASLDLVKIAKSMGIYTIVVDDRPTGPAKEIADQTAIISTTDIDALAAYAKESRADGVFCSPSEFQILNTMKVCKKGGYRFYADKEAWDRCGNKQSLKEYCRKNELPVIPEFHFENTEQVENCPENMFPVIVKPVDGASSRGVKVCKEKSELKAAVEEALQFSRSGNVLVEKYIDNGGRLFSFRYILDDGNCYPYMLMDTYIADPVNKKHLISAFSYIPSEYGAEYMKTTDKKVRNMLCDMGLKNGTVFAQALPFDNEFYCHDMGYRLSGGMTYSICQALTDINDMKMMIRYAVGGPICTEEDMRNINPVPEGKVVGQLMIPINAGTIAEIKGLDAVKNEASIVQFLQYYHEGDTVSEKAIGTLSQQFARIAVMAESKDELVSIINRLQDSISIKDTDGNEMYTMRFDTNRLYK